MWESSRLKLRTVLSLLLCFNCACTIWAQNINSEKNWIVVNEISCWERNGHWENETVCSKSKIVSGHRFRFLSRTGLTGIQLKCNEKYRADESESEEILEMNSKDEAGINLPRGEWENWTEKSHSSFAVGFAFAPGEMNLRRSVKNFEVIYHNGNPMEMAKQMALNLNSGRVVTKCPEDHAICGVKVMMDKEKLGILTEIGLKCCFHCIPEEKWVTAHEFDNSKLVDARVEVKTTVGLGRELQNTNTPFDSRNTLDSLEISVLNLQKIFVLIGQSTLTGFDWVRTAPSMWTDERTEIKMYSCGAGRSCVFKQLVGQCGSVRVLVDKFCQGSVPVGKVVPDSCIDLQLLTSCSDSIEFLPSSRLTKQTVYPHGKGNMTSLQVLCDFDVDGGEWTIIQKRSSGPRDEFNRNWNVYVEGFGSLDGNFWLGLENIHALTKNGDQELRIQLEDFEGNKTYAEYSSFSISDASDFYRLNMSGFSLDSTAGDSMTNHGSGRTNLLNGMQFTTKDKDNDKNSNKNCAAAYGGGRGGWWYNVCSVSKLNGRYRRKGETFPDWNGIMWYSWKGEKESLAKTEMKIRKRKSKSKSP